MPARPPAPRPSSTPRRPSSPQSQSTPQSPSTPQPGAATKPGTAPHRGTSAPPARPAAARATAPRPRPARSRRRGGRAARAVAGTVAFVGVVAGAGAGVAAYLDHLDATPLVVRCAASLDGTDWYLDPDQADTVALLAATSVRRGLPARATTIAIATGLQESKLRNIDYGDRDSLGIFQQRPSQGWGTPEQVMDPVYATNAFYDGLVKVAGYEDMAITEAAQAVQRSGFPDAYAQHEGRARAWASAMYGYSPAALTCSLPRAEGAGDAATLAGRVERDLGALPVTVSAGADGEGLLDVDASVLAGAPEDADRMAWIVAHWAVSVASTHDVVRVQHGATAWDRGEAAWDAAEGDPVPTGVVRITLAG